MKRTFALCAALVLALSLPFAEAEAKRLGGGRSLGMQRSPVTDSARQATPPQSPQAPAAMQPQAGRAQAAAAAAPAAAAQSGWRRWAAPLAGLAAGIGLAALASHLGMSGEFAGILLALGVALIAFMLIRRFMAARSGAPAAGGMQYAGAAAGAGAGNATPYRAPLTELNGAGAVGSAPLASGGRVPSGFDVEAFVRNAKVSFIRLQAAFDAANLDDIREFTSPEMFAELKLDIASRSGVNKTDVVVLNADLLDVSEEATRHLASVRFHGSLREDAASAPQSFDEVWHLSKPADGSRGWVLAGIEQMQ